MGAHPRAPTLPLLRGGPLAECAARTGDSDTATTTTETTKDHYVNIRSLTRGDGAVIGAAVLLLIASFLPYFSVDKCDTSDCSVNGWEPSLFPLLPTVTLAGIIAAALVVAARALPQGRKLLGIELAHWGAVVAVFTAWSAVWSLFGDLAYDPQNQGVNDHISLGAGAYLSLAGALLLAAGAVFGGTVPALSAPLLPAAKSAQPQPAYGGQQPYGAQPDGGYGYPAGGQPSYGGQQQPGTPLGSTGQVPGAGAPQQQAPAAPEFAPFWFAVPVTRPLYAEDGSPNPVAELTPGTWYLAVDQRGSALVAQTQDGRRGVLQDTTGIQRG